MRIMALLSVILGFVCSVPLQAEENPAIPDDYQLRYHQDFEGANPLDDFAFTDASAWQLKENSGNHSMALTQDSDYKPPHRSPRNIALVRGRQFGSFVMEAQVKYTGRDYNHADQCLFFGFQDPTHYYYTHIGKRQDPHAHQIFIVNEKPRTKITDKSRTDGFPWKQGRWEKVRVVRDAKAGAIKVFIRNMKEPLFVASDSHFKSGWLGFGTFDDRGQVDNIHVWAPANSVNNKQISAFEQK